MPFTQYTLIVPTYNRPADLRRLLRFLAHQKATFPILVLDSSRAPLHEQNLAECRALPLSLTLQRFDSEISPWEKFSRGAAMVSTQYASLCADDDLVLVSGIGAVLDFMARNRDFSAAHGWYFNFYLAGAFGLTRVIYRGPSLDSDDPAQRLWQLFSGYEALTYAVHRTEVLQKSLSRAQRVQSMLARELLGAAVAAISGKVARLPVPYAGRSLGPSVGYSDWHPVDFLISSPQALFEEYRVYRAALLEHWQDCGHPFQDPAAVTRLVDLAHLRYAAEYFKPEILDYVQSELRKGRSREDIVAGVRPLLAGRTGLEASLQRSRLLRRLRDWLAPWLQPYHVRMVTRRHAYRTERAVTAGGASRVYHVYRDFEEQLGRAALRAQLLSTLAGYE